MNEEINSIKNSTEEAREKVLAIRQECLQMGANDFEPSAFDEILQKLESGEYTQEKAMAEAYLILNRKADYH